MLNRLRVVTIAVIVVLPLTLGCGGDGGAGAGNAVHAVTLAAGTHWCDAEGGFADVVVEADAILATPGPDAPAVAVGDRLVGGPGSGVARRVTGITQLGGGRVQYDTEDAPLDEAFDRLELSFDIELDGLTGTQTDGAVTPVSAGVAVDPRDEQVSIPFDLSGTELYDNGTLRVEITTGTLDVTARAAGDYSTFGDSDVTIVLTTQLTATIAVTLSGSFDHELAIPIPGAAFRAAVKLGRLSAHLDVGVFAGFGVAADAAVTMTSTLTYTDRVSVHASYSLLGGWDGDEPIHTNTFTYTEPVVSGEANAELTAWIGPVLELEILGTKGIEMAYNAFAKLTGDFWFSSDLGKSYGFVFGAGLGGGITTFPEWNDSALQTSWELPGVDLYSWEYHQRLVTGTIDVPDLNGVSVALSGTAVNPAGPISRSATPDDDGVYVFEGVPQGGAAGPCFYMWWVF
jgi:hypothetical protein